MLNPAAGLEKRLTGTNQFTEVSVTFKDDAVVVKGRLRHKLTDFEFEGKGNKGGIKFYNDCPNVFWRWLAFPAVVLLVWCIVGGCINSYFGFSPTSLMGNITAIPGILSVLWSGWYGSQCDERVRVRLGPKLFDRRTEVMNDGRFAEVLTAHQWGDVLLEWCEAHRRKYPYIDGGYA